MYHHGNTLIKFTLHDETKKRAHDSQIVRAKENLKLSHDSRRAIKEETYTSLPANDVFRALYLQKYRSFVDHFCYLCLVLLCFHVRLFVVALWSSAGKGADLLALVWDILL